jgi:cytochrome c553
MLAGAATALIALAVLGVVVMTSGVYSVAASRGHWEITRQILEFAMKRSIATHSWFAPRPPPLDDPDLVQLGAGHFLRGCAPCHSAPGEPKSPIVERMLPSPPRLSLTTHTWSDVELFWIVKHGIKYTGMPAWPGQARDDEVWAMVAFLRQLPQMSVDEYRSMAEGGRDREKAASLDLPHYDRQSALITECARCHGDESSPPQSRLVPQLSGQTAAYLERALKDYANGTRQSGTMQPQAIVLDENERAAIAAHYARARRQEHARPAASIEPIERGRRIANEGVVRDGIPPCLGCHAGRSAESFPLLSGQPAAYLIQQLKLWRAGHRAQTVQGAIMAPIARRLSDAQIEDVAAYFEGRNLSDDIRAAPVTVSGDAR